METIRCSSGSYEPRPDGYGREVEETFIAPTVKHAPQRAEAHTGGAGKVYYQLIGEGAVPAELRQAAHWTAETVRLSFRIPNRVQIHWMKELIPEEDEYFSLYPQDLEDPIDPEWQIITLDERVLGLARASLNFYFSHRRQPVTAGDHRANCA